MISSPFDPPSNMPGTSSTLEPEWSLLCAACSPSDTPEQLNRIRTLLQSPIRWNVLLDLGDRHAVKPLLCHRLSSVQDLVPAEDSASMQKTFHANLRKTLLLSRELIRIVDLLTNAGIGVMPYKGLALAELLYHDIALREAGDIDLLIRPTDLSRVRERVQELGYAPHVAFSQAEEEAYLKSGYEYAFDGTAGPNLLEVQWAIQPRFYAVDLDVSRLFKNAVTLPVAGYSVNTPCLEDLFLVLALHAAKHAWAKLIWLCDLARIMTMPRVEWAQIAAQATELGIVRMVRVTLKLANQLLATEIPQEAEKHLPHDSVAAALASGVQAQIVSGSEFDVESLAYFRLMLRLRERRFDQLRMLSRLVLTPGPSEWSAIRLPPRLFPLYRLVRLSRLAAKLVTA